jgi:hypothetical protein
MTPATSYRTPDQLLDQLAKYQELHRQAVRRRNVPLANLQLLKVIAAADGLAAISRDRDSIMVSKYWNHIGAATLGGTTASAANKDVRDKVRRSRI